MEKKQFIPDFPVIPMRKSDSLNISQILTNALNQSMLPKESAQILQNLTKFRQTLITGEPSPQFRENGWKYCEYLTQIMTRVSCNVTFVWYDSYLTDQNKKPLRQTGNSLEFEKANIFYNIGCSCMSLGGSYSKTADVESLKNSIQHFQYAAFFYQKSIDCAQKVGINDGDLNPRRVQTLFTMALGCAHLVLHLNAVIQNKSKSLQLKLASAAQNQLNPSVEAFKSFYKITIGYQFLSNFIVIKNFSIYSTQIMAAKIAEEEMKFGEQVKRLKWAMKATERAASIAYSSSNKTALKQLYTETKSIYQKAEKDNNNIYMNSLPRRRDLPVVPEILAAKPIEMESIPDAFDKMVPSHLAKAINEYNQKAQRILTDSKNVCESKTNEGDNMIKQLKNQNSSVPQDLLIQSKKYQQMNVYDLIQNQLNLVEQYQNESKKHYANSIAALDAEQAEDKRYRQQFPYQWNRATPEMASFNQRRESEKYRNALQQGKQVDDMMFNKWNKCQQEIKLLSNDISHLFKVDIDINSIERQWNEIKIERQKALNELIENFNKNEELKVSTIKTGNGSAQSIQSLLVSFENGKGTIQKGLYKQDDLFKQIPSIGSSSSSNLTSSLRNAVNVIEEILKIIPQSLQFNKDAVEKLTQFEQNCLLYQSTRHDEALLMVSNLTQSSQSQYNPQYPSQYNANQSQYNSQYSSSNNYFPQL